MLYVFYCSKNIVQGSSPSFSDCRPSERPSDQDAPAIKKVFSRIRRDQIIHWGRRNTRYHNRRLASDNFIYSTCYISYTVTIRLAPVLPTNVAVVQFPNVRNATEAVVDILNQGVGIRKPSSVNHLTALKRSVECIELVDDVFMKATNIYGQSKRRWPEKDSLFMKFQGPTPQSLKETADIVKKVAQRHGGTGFELARNQQEANDLWTDRKNAHYAGLALIENAKGWPTDVW